MDDDNYVNPRALLKLLKAFPQTRDVYVGRPSLNRPIRASEPRPHNHTVGPLVPSFLLPPSCVDHGATWGRGHQGGAIWGAEPCGGGARWVFWLSHLVSSLCVWVADFTTDPVFSVKWGGSDNAGEAQTPACSRASVTEEQRLLLVTQ